VILSTGYEQSLYFNSLELHKQRKYERQYDHERQYKKDYLIRAGTIGLFRLYLAFCHYDRTFLMFLEGGVDNPLQFLNCNRLGNITVCAQL
jgi:hypothetical protein